MTDKTGIGPEDVAKRLQDYSYHTPTIVARVWHSHD